MKKVQELAYDIYFCDAQENVYSLSIADLIVRYVVEIESIAIDNFWCEIANISNGSKELILRQFYILNKAKEIISINAKRNKAVFWAELNIENMCIE